MDYLPFTSEYIVLLCVLVQHPYHKGKLHNEKDNPKMCFCWGLMETELDSLWQSQVMTDFCGTVMSWSRVTGAPTYGLKKGVPAPSP